MDSGSFMHFGVVEQCSEVGFQHFKKKKKKGSMTSYTIHKGRKVPLGCLIRGW